MSTKRAASGSLFEGDKKQRTTEDLDDEIVPLARKSKLINDPIHGHFDLSGLAVAIIDTPEFQRMFFVMRARARVCVCV